MNNADTLKNEPGEFDLGRAVSEAARCLLCYDAPCSAGCPAGTDPGRFIRKLRLRNITGAIRTIKENNILGGACGELCPTCQLCEKNCVSTGIDRAIQIGKIQSFLVEYSRQIGFKPLHSAERRPEKAAVIGSGPAGLSFASELAKNGIQVTIFERMPEPGGVLRYGVPSFRYPLEKLNREIEDVRALGVEIKCSSPIEGKGGAEKLLKEGYSVVFIAPGLWQSKPLNGGKGIKGVIPSVHFLKTLREGRDGEMKKLAAGKNVGVIGGGSVAIDCATSALRLGAKNVYLIYRRSFNEMPATEEERLTALKEGVHLLVLSKPVEYVSDKNGNLKQIKIMRTELGEPDSSGRRRPVDVPGSQWLLDADLVIEAIGQEAEENSPDWYPSIKVDKENLVIINQDTGETNIPGIYAGGDIVRGPALIVEAVKDGKTAARAVLMGEKNLMREAAKC